MKERISHNEISENVNWEPWVLLVAILTLIASVIIPFAQKKYEEFRAKRNFQYYLKKQIGLVLNQLTIIKLEYVDPSVRNEPEKDQLFIKDFVLNLKKDFEIHKNSVQPRVIFMLLMNVQKLCHFSYELRQNIRAINLQTITENTLEHGKKLTKKELNNIYGIILIYECFVSISQRHDKFGEIKSIKRLMENENWVGLAVEKDLLTNQDRLNDDLLVLNDNKMSLDELENIVLILNQETKKYFDFDNIQGKRKN